MTKMSLSARGTPARGPSSSPRAMRSSTRRAAARAPSWSTVMKALSLGPSWSMRVEVGIGDLGGANDLVADRLDQRRHAQVEDLHVSSHAGNSLLAVSR